MNETTKAVMEKGKAVATEKLGQLSDKADAIPFLKGNKTRKLIALGGVAILAVLCLSWLFGGGIESDVEDFMRKDINKQWSDRGVEVYDISDMKLEKRGDRYVGTAKVVFKSNGKRSKPFSYDIEVSKDGDTIAYVCTELVGAALLEAILSDDED